jgi:hypothetical protein
MGWKMVKFRPNHGNLKANPNESFNNHRDKVVEKLQM